MMRLLYGLSAGVNLHRALHSTHYLSSRVASTGRRCQTFLYSTESAQPRHLVFKFEEEPLGLPASNGYGYFQGRPGHSIGPGGRFKLSSKLAFGMASSVWIARDTECDTLRELGYVFFAEHIPIYTAPTNTSLSKS